MPFRIQFVRAYIELWLEGDLTAAELTAATSELGKLEDGLDRIPDRLTDLSSVEHREIHYPLVLAIATVRRERIFRNNFRSAIVAPTLVSFGFARMFQTLNDNPQIELRVFESREPALAWLTTSAPS